MMREPPDKDYKANDLEKKSYNLYRNLSGIVYRSGIPYRNGWVTCVTGARWKMCTKRSFSILVFSLLLALLLGSAQQPNAAGAPARHAAAQAVASLELGGGPVTNWFPISLINATHPNEYHPAVAYNSYWGEYLVVWDQADNSTGHSYIYGQFVASNGSMIGPRFVIPGFDGYGGSPDVAYNSARNEYLVVYEFGLPPTSGIYGMRLDAYGSPLGSQLIFATSTTYGYREAAVAYAGGSGSYLVAWQKVSGSAFNGIEARSISGDGASMSSILEITGLLANVAPSKPDVACTRPLDECLVVWQKWYDTNYTDHDILGHRIHMTGGAHLEGTGLSIFFSLNDEDTPAIAAVNRITGIGQYLVVCEYSSGGSWSIVGQLVTDGGALFSGVSIGPSNGGAPAVAGSDTSQEYLIAWPTVPGTDMQARTVSTLGNLGVTTLPLPAGSAPIYPAVAGGPLGDYLVAVQDYQPGYPIDIFGYLWGTRLYLPMLAR